jgi:hypothetical protein
MSLPRRYPIYDSWRACVAPLAIGVVVCLAAACAQEAGPATSKGSYDPETGQLRQITYDRDENGRIDTWTRMEGTRPISSEIDTDEDGIIDRWEEYDAEGALTRAGWIRPVSPNPGEVDQAPPDPSPPQPDTWLYPAADGTSHRIDFLDIDNAGGQIVTRREFYEREQLARVEEDKDGDAVVDQWETWENGTLRTVEFDDGRDGKPDRRFSYADGALVLIESAPDAQGRYTRRVVPG